jgi:aryl-alcohol dehydrogenase-like predicted oxidoreductase
MREGPYAAGLSRRWIVQAIEDSLRRLGTDYVDLYQAHSPDDHTPLEETLRAMDDLVHQGKVRYVGCSNYKAWELTDAVRTAERMGLERWVSLQQRWNILEGLDDETHLDACRRLGVGIIPYTPLASGMLTGKYHPGEEPPAGTKAAEQPNVRAKLTVERLHAVERLRPWAEAHGRSLADVAVGYLLSYAQVSSVIIGARNAAQVDQNVRLGQRILTREERAEVDALVRG